MVEFGGCSGRPQAFGSKIKVIYQNSIFFLIGHSLYFVFLSLSLFYISVLVSLYILWNLIKTKQDITYDADKYNSDA